MKPDSTVNGQPRNRRVAAAEDGAPLDLCFGTPQGLASDSADGARAETGRVEGGEQPRRVVSRRAWILRGVLGAALLAGAAVGGWYALPVKTVAVEGNERLTDARVLELAGLQPGFGWLYYGAWRARGLLDSPWVASATVTRVFPGTVRIRVNERVARARYERPDGLVLTVAGDGTPLPGALNTQTLPLVSGWGPPRLGDVLPVLSALSRYNVQSVVFTPTGLTLKLPSGSIWSGDPQALVKYAGSIDMFPSKNIFIYPWGVSVQE
ncbi:FtsQ-type POTRA domain-containing protein [Deinococcus sp.]|uniref:cell division protein FtsQ/DivIB n=1 Tax=Deinococcus sp. TaxID=47478 RepID=UPI0025BC9FA5|nr:FtsQ-type POTRA domain-containing protein [Deinococcus sp.]